MKSRFLFAVLVSVLIFVSCGDDPNFVELTWVGTWMSTKNYDERGTFTFNLEIDYEEISGTITIPGMGIEDLEVVGIADKGYSPSGVGGSGTVVVTDIDFSDKENKLTFSSGVFTHELDSDTKLTGRYSNSETGDFGCWYCKYEDRNDFSSISSVPLDSSIGSVRDMCFDGENLWVSEIDSGYTIIYKVDEGNGTIIESFDIYGTGLAWDGLNLWCVGYDSLYKLDNSCSIESSIPFEEGGRYLTYASGSLWSIVSGGFMFEDELCEINPSNGNIESSFDFYSRNLGGLASDGTYLWASFSYDQYDWNVIEKMDLQGNVIERYNSPCYTPGSLASDGSSLYCIGSDINSHEKRIFKLGF